MKTLNTYASLGAEFYQAIEPTPVSAPRLLLWNGPLAEELRLDPEALQSDEQKASIFAGNVVLPDFQPIALAYAGHQFGGFVPSLGDGRAHLLGEVVDRDGLGREIQLKGSGPTRFSRGGDGRCALGPAVREFIMSEAMFGLGVPTTRSLCVVQSGETVRRQRPQPGAIVTRVARSHLRVGTFQYFAARHNTDAIRTLVDYAVERLFPDIEASSGPERALAFFERVVSAQIATVTAWMRVGFIHGVMNTDNTSISGETIDFGPCAMLNAYDLETVYSSIDHRGRYAFGNQPVVLAWNMARLAETLLPLLHEDSDRAIDMIQPRLNEVPDRIDAAWRAMLRTKIGLSELGPDDESLVTDLQQLMQQHGLDHTNTFAALSGALDDTADSPLPSELDPWLLRWRSRFDDAGSRANAQALMRRTNPRVIPRNHDVEAALAAVVERGDTGPAERLVEVLRDPYDVGPSTAAYTDPPADGDRGYQTFCGT
ncbi:MAG: YdiU family protein [Myxococcales bacterium]|nr:YdiU family protein [Myxococcales bacterium]